MAYTESMYNNMTKSKDEYVRETRLLLLYYAVSLTKMVEVVISHPSEMTRGH